MTYIDPEAMTQDKRQALLEWLLGEGLVASEIVADNKFSVEAGSISGFKYLFDENGKIVFRKTQNTSYPVKVHFRQRQKNPLPEVLQA